MEKIDLKEFAKRWFKVPLIEHQEALIDHFESGKKMVIGWDNGSPQGDKTCKIYGHTCDGRLIIDDVATE